MRHPAGFETPSFLAEKKEKYNSRTRLYRLSWEGGFPFSRDWIVPLNEIFLVIDSRFLSAQFCIHT